MSEQLALIPPIDTSRRAAQATALEAAKARGDLGMARVGDSADRQSPGWCEKACEALRAFAAAQGGVFIIEHARLAVRDQLPPVMDARAWGVATRLAVQRGYIEPVRGQYFPAASSNGSPKRVYRKGPAV